MKSCPYIQFGTLSFAAGVEFKAPVWRRATTCSLLQISERQFVELCIYLGNDFTKVYAKTLFKRPPSCDVPEQELGSTPLADGMMWSSDDPELQRAIEFSRDFYELRDLTHYDYDPRLDYAWTYSLRVVEELRLHDIFNENRELGMHELFSKCFSIRQLNNTEGRLNALQRTTSDLTLSTSTSNVANGSDNRKVTRDVPVFEWDDVIAADFYQMIYREWRYWLTTQPTVNVSTIYSSYTHHFFYLFTHVFILYIPYIRYRS